MGGGVCCCLYVFYVCVECFGCGSVVCGYVCWDVNLVGYDVDCGWGFVLIYLECCYWVWCDVYDLFWYGSVIGGGGFVYCLGFVVSWGYCWMVGLNYVECVVGVEF